MCPKEVIDEYIHCEHSIWIVVSSFAQPSYAEFWLMLVGLNELAQIVEKVTFLALFVVQLELMGMLRCTERSR
jgi:hypothetical protein